MTFLIFRSWKGRALKSNQISEAAYLNADMASDVDNRESSGVNFYPNDEQSLSQGSSQAGEDNIGSSGSSLGFWGSSCKRKALEGASGCTISGERTGCFSEAEGSFWHAGPSQHQASSSYSLSTAPQNFPNINSRSNTYSSVGQLTRRLNLGQQPEYGPFSLSSGQNLNEVQVSAPYVESLDVRSTRQVNSNSSASEIQNNIIHHPALTRNIHHLAWNRISSSRTESSSSALNSKERFVAPWEDANMRDAARNNTEHPMFVPENERHPVQNHSVWSLSSAGGNHSASENVPIASRARDPSSGIEPLQPTAAWIPHQNISVHNSQRIPKMPPWSLFPSVESESSYHGGSSPLPSRPVISLTEAAVPSGSNSRSSRSRPRRSGIFSRRSAILLERQIDDLANLHQLGNSMAADVHRRNRLISQVRHVLRSRHSGNDSRIEDYMVFGPPIRHGMPDIHNRHRDMRLDIDNMSYEELLALGERIGEVNTGLSEEIILKTMKQYKYASRVSSKSQHEQCCICREEYMEGDEVGSLNCGHGFHTGCIKQWIMLKNICPICKTTGLSP